MKKILSSFFDSVMDILFPSLCLDCGESIVSDEMLCARCFENIYINRSLFCGKCGARLPSLKKICHLDFPYILGAAASYKDELPRLLVHELKFKFVRNAARPLAEILAIYARNAGLTEDDWLVVPVPLGPKRFRRRGYNQSEIIAKIFAETLSIKIENDGFVRSKETKPQSEMRDFESRVENTKECFSVVSPEKFAGKNIILIDDVSTSGITFFEAATSLKKSGAKKIVALASVKG
ncbi:MAG: ComF family protein [Candidatus Liptonbacteria bacterium]|nr:ComF family protein [Candidatus Liptonbacteria bacterium]